MTGWKKNPTAADCREFMHKPTEWPGKKPKAPGVTCQRAVVVGPTARLADAWSTAALVLGRRAEAMPPAYALLGEVPTADR